MSMLYNDNLLALKNPFPSKYTTTPKAALREKQGFKAQQNPFIPFSSDLPPQTVRNTPSGWAWMPHKKYSTDTHYRRLATKSILPFLPLNLNHLKIPRKE